MVATQYLHPLGPWEGGVVYALPPELIGADALSAMQNIEIGLGGVAKTRPGYSKYISGAISGPPTLTAVGEAIFSSSSSRVFVIAGTVFYEDVAGTWTDRTAAITITAGDDNTWQWVNCNGDLYATSTSLADVQIKWTAAAADIVNATVSARFTKARYCDWWDNRLWYAVTDASEVRVWFSGVLTPETVGATDFLTFDGIVTGLKGLRTVLTVHTENSIHFVYYDNVLAAYVQQKRADRGAVSARSIVLNGQGQMFFVRKDGIYRWDVDSPIATEVSGTPQKISIALDGDQYWNQINKARLHQSWAVDYPDKNCIWFMLPYGTSQTDMNHIMVYDYDRNIWYGPYLNFTRNCGALIANVPHLGGYDDGLLYKYEDGTADNGVAIDAWFDTAAVPAIETGVDVRWLWAVNSFDVTGDYDINVQQIGDRLVTLTDSFNGGGGHERIEDTFTIGISSIAGEEILRSEDTQLQGYSDGTQLRYNNANLNEQLAIRHAHLAYVPIGVLPHQLPGVS
jgi:hypothetical protein